jgi:hypothetical protein
MLVGVNVVFVVVLFAVGFWVDRSRRRHGMSGSTGQRRNDIDPGQWTGGGS